jgi:hypothetical protein
MLLVNNMIRSTGASNDLILRENNFRPHLSVKDERRCIMTVLGAGIKDCPSPRTCGSVEDNILLPSVGKHQALTT